MKTLLEKLKHHVTGAIERGEAQAITEVKPISSEAFEKIVSDAQEIQKRHPFGSPEHRAAYDTIRKAVLAHKGTDIGEYC